MKTWQRWESNPLSTGYEPAGSPFAFAAVNAGMMKIPWETISWWERRRVSYNVMLLVLGILTIVVLEVVGSFYAHSGEDAIEPLGIIVGALFFGVAANVCYTLGWITEVLWFGTSNPEVNARRRLKLFWAGMILSAGLTLLPAILLPILWAVFGFQHGPQ
jgi:hypothetical protein